MFSWYSLHRTAEVLYGARRPLMRLLARSMRAAGLPWGVGGGVMVTYPHVVPNIYNAYKQTPQ
jgi:hypothetical protein